MILLKEYFANFIKFKESSTQRIQKIHSLLSKMCDFHENVLLPELRSKRDNWNRVNTGVCDFLLNNLTTVQLYEQFAEEFEDFLKEFSSLFDNDRLKALIDFLDKKVILIFRLLFLIKSLIYFFERFMTNTRI